VDFIIVCSFGLLLLLCTSVLLEWIVFTLRGSLWWRPYSWRARFRSWRSAPRVKGFRIRSVPGKGPSLGSLKVTRARWESLNGGPPEPPPGA
jgi:hypothetical protein